MPRLHLPLLLLAAALPGLHAATLTQVGVTVTETFDTAPAAADWKTLGVAGDSNRFTSVAGLDAGVNAGSGSTPAFSTNLALVALNSGTTSAANTNAGHNSTTKRIFTRPTGNAYTALVATLTNNTGATLSTVTVNYDLQVTAYNNEHAAGHRVFYSLTGAAGSWVKLADVSGISTSQACIQAISGISLAPGAKLYVLWADDNASLNGGTDDILGIDNVEWNCEAAPVQPPVAPATPIAFGSSWKFNDKGVDLGTAWRASAYDDALWSAGNGQLGYGNGDETTVVSYGPSSSSKYITTYFRKKFTIENLAAVNTLTLDSIYDDGAVIYINGVEARRINFAAGTTVGYSTLASLSSNNAGDTVTLTDLAPFNLVQGENTIAVEIHQSAGSSSDISFDLQLKTTPPPLHPVSATRRYRAIWNEDPAHKITLAWEQVSGGAAIVHYGTVDNGQNVAAYPEAHVVDRQVTASGMNTCFARLANLLPDTDYYFVLSDDSGVSERFKFHTAPADSTKPFTFIAGGDTRSNQLPRQRGNKLVAKLRPLFIAFGGDMTANCTDQELQQWLDDWQLSFTSDRRIIPLIMNRGNHENSTVLPALFDTNANTYFAVDIGGNMMRYYSLNTQIAAAGAQTTWLTGDLNANSARVRHLMASYHVPMRPHYTGKVEGTAHYDAWATPFYNAGMDLVFESDTHVMKRTMPVRPNAAGDQGFSIANGDANAFVFTGEGCWGAPLRPADDGKSWTLAMGSFNAFDWVQVSWDKIDLRTVLIDAADATAEMTTDYSYVKPAGMQVWQPASGEMVTVPGDGGQP